MTDWCQAPDVFSYGGTYYMYYAVSSSGSQNSDIGVATSPSMDVGTVSSSTMEAQASTRRSHAE